ncbi:hypothetical protein WOLCODRAFT_80289, partial [Wolfiporia cocos MD-104 SS10]
GIKEHRRYGEAGSIDLEAAKVEQKRVSGEFKKYPPADNLNLNESSLFGFAPPDRGLLSIQLSGKKSVKTWITLCFMCNATGAEKYPIFFIGKSKQPHCFGKKSLKDHGFYYHHNKTAWMTTVFFEECVPLPQLLHP